MAVFYQQSGKRGEADFLKTLATPERALRQFTAPDLEREFGFEVVPEALRNLSIGAGFQIWGVPSGARHVVSGMQPGDLMLLIGQLSPNALDFGRFFYAGRVVYTLTTEDFSLSRQLWGDGGFPIIFFMQGALLEYSWRDFTTDFGLAPNYYVAGQTMRLKAERLAASSYRDLDGFAAKLGVDTDALRITHPIIPAQLAFEEGARSLRTHVALERSRDLVNAFKAQLADFSCSVCGFDFERTYGSVGTGFIEAHHIEPLSARGAGAASIEDLIGVCANCHRMLHRKWPFIDVGGLKAVLASNAQG